MIIRDVATSGHDELAIHASVPNVKWQKLVMLSQDLVLLGDIHIIQQTMHREGLNEDL